MYILMFLLYVALALAVTTFLYTQAVVPILRNTPLFPVLRKEKKLNEDLRDARQGTVEKRIQEQIKKEKGR
jgi:hypothetical protein